MLRDGLANPVDRRVLKPAIGGCGRTPRAPRELVWELHRQRLTHQPRLHWIPLPPELTAP